MTAKLNPLRRNQRRLALSLWLVVVSAVVAVLRVLALRECDLLQIRPICAEVEASVTMSITTEVMALIQLGLVIIYCVVVEIDDRESARDREVGHG